MTGKRGVESGRSHHSPSRFEPAGSRLGMVFAVALAAAALLGLAASAQAKKKPPIEKSVAGQVVDAGGNPISGATIELTDQSTSKTLALYSDTSGNYRFSGLDRTHDYSIQAKSRGLQSEVRHVSYLDTRDEIVINLTVGASKE